MSRMNLDLAMDWIKGIADEWERGEETTVGALFRIGQVVAHNPLSPEEIAADTAATETES